MLFQKIVYARTVGVIPGERVTYRVWIRMSEFLGLSTDLQMSSWVAAMATLLEMHRWDR